jgi:alpha-ketoglutarate-dependent taurine dioxygenase
MTAILDPNLATLGPVTGHLQGNDHTNVVVYPIGPEVKDGLGWVKSHSQSLRAGLNVHGATLLRGLPADIGLFNDVVRTVGGELLAYTERSTPRSAVSGNIYTSTEYPSDQTIPMHNENSYSDSWPTTLFFFCQIAAESGGATPVADSRAVFRLIPQAVRDRFSAGVIYSRMFREGLGLSWQESFQTQDRAVVQEYCDRHHQEFEWIDSDLRTRHHRPAWQREPHGGQDVWFNQAYLFHVSNLEEDVREALLSLYDEAELPRNAYLGDGSPISPDDLAAVAAAYDQAALAWPWVPGDILIVNNILMAHGRQPYTGERRTLVAMS